MFMAEKSTKKSTNTPKKAGKKQKSSPAKQAPSKSHLSKSHLSKSHLSKSRSIKKAEMTHAETVLAREVKELSKEVRKIKSLEFFKFFKSPWKFIGFSLLKGIMVGFGTVLGASVIVGLVVYLLAKISFVPVIGEFVEDVIEQIDSGGTEEDQSFFEQYNETREGLNNGAPAS